MCVGQPILHISTTVLYKRSPSKALVLMVEETISKEPLGIIRGIINIGQEFVHLQRLQRDALREGYVVVKMMMKSQI